jgi:hypothetical protein
MPTLTNVIATPVHAKRDIVATNRVRVVDCCLAMNSLAWSDR